MEDMVRLGKESGLHSFEQVTITFPMVVAALQAVMRIKVTSGDPDLDCLPPRCGHRQALHPRSHEGLFQPDGHSLCPGLKWVIDRVRPLAVLSLTDVQEAETGP